MTAQKSFSDLLKAKLDEDAAKLEAEKKAQEEEQWLLRVNTTAAWLRLVFNDDDFELLGYKLKRRIKSRQGDHFLTVYVRVGNFVYGLVTSQNNNRYKAYFGICVLRTGRSGVSSQLFNLHQMYEENKVLQCLEFQADFSDTSGQPITREGAQSEMIREQTLEHIVTATVNVLRRRPELAEQVTCQTIIKDLPKHRNMHMLVSDSGSTNPKPEPAKNTEEYLANIPPTILNMAIEELIPVPSHKGAALQREKDLKHLKQSGVGLVKDVLVLDLGDLWQAGDYKHWATGAVVEQLAKLDLEIVPPAGNKYLPAGVPKTVKQLLEQSGLKEIERPRNCLGRAQIVTTQQLINKTADDLLTITNFGRRSLTTVSDALAQHGLNLKQE